MQVHQAGIADLHTLLPLMRGYYRDDGLTFDVARATGTLARLLTEPRWGHVYLLHLDAAVIGYVAICFSFSLELGGNDAYVDEMFVLPQHRGHGHGMESLQQIAPLLAASGIRALHLEVDRDNTAAQQLYARVGFERRDRYFIMTRSIGT